MGRNAHQAAASTMRRELAGMGGGELEPATSGVTGCEDETTADDD